MTSPNTIHIDGANGGGQLLRSSLSLSLITGQPFHMVNIRGARKPKPGLMRQHLTCVRAAAEVGAAEVQGAELGSLELHFTPGQVKPGDYQFAIGTGGSTTLVFQTLLPALLCAGAVSTVKITGGTHNPMAPPADFIEKCFLPQLRKMGAKVSFALEKPGFMQAGGGVMVASVQPLKKWKRLHLTERGGAGELSGQILHAHLAPNIAERIRFTSADLIRWDINQIQVCDAPESDGPGSILMLEAAFQHVTEITSSVAQMGRTAESVGASAAKGMANYLQSAAVAGVCLADQLLLPMALSGGGSLVTLTLSKHLLSSMELIPKFLPVAFTTETLGGGGVKITVSSTVKKER